MVNKNKRIDKESILNKKQFLDGQNDFNYNEQFVSFYFSIGISNN